MNTADRSIRSIDIALRRRFDVFECPPIAAILERFYDTARTQRGRDLVDGFDELNAQLEAALDRHHTIGHAFFMAERDDRRPASRESGTERSPRCSRSTSSIRTISPPSFTLARFWPGMGDAE